MERLLPLLPYALLAFVLTFSLTVLVRRLAVAYGIVTTPRERDVHKKPIPRLGGVAIIISFLLIFALAQLLAPHILWFTDEIRLGFDRHALGLMAGIIILLGFGLLDDIKGLTPGQQFFGQALAAIAVIFSGIGIDFITNPFGPDGSVIALNHVTWYVGELSGRSISITLWSDLFTFIWLVGLMNVMNWFDGLDGLASGVSGIAAVLLALLSVAVGSPVGIIAMLLILAGSLLGFLPWNWFPAKIFMGTAGSTFLGFILGVSAIISGGKIATALLILGVPVLDAIWVILRRIVARQPIFKADRRHLHHRLLDVGLNTRATVLIMYFLSILFGSLALWRNNTDIKILLAFLLCLIVIVIGFLTVKVEKIKKHETTN